MNFEKDHNKQNLIVAANIVQIAVEVIDEVAGNEVSNHVNGERMETGDLANTVCARAQTHYSSKMETA